MPVSGGIYDQDPRLLSEFAIINHELAEVRDKETEDLEGKAEGYAKSSKTPPIQKSYSSGKAGGMNFKRVPKIPPVFEGYHKE